MNPPRYATALVWTIFRNASKTLRDFTATGMCTTHTVCSDAECGGIKNSTQMFAVHNCQDSCLRYIGHCHKNTMRCLFFGPQDDELANWGGNAHHSINVSDRESKNMQGALFTVISMSDRDFVIKLHFKLCSLPENPQISLRLLSNRHAFIAKQN